MWTGADGLLRRRRRPGVVYSCSLDDSNLLFARFRHLSWTSQRHGFLFFFFFFFWSTPFPCGRFGLERSAWSAQAPPPRKHVGIYICIPDTAGSVETQQSLRAAGERSAGGGRVRTNVAILGRVCSVRGFCVKCVFEECVETKLGLCWEDESSSLVLGSPAPAAPPEMDAESRVLGRSQTHERTATQLFSGPESCVFLFLHSFFFFF